MHKFFFLTVLTILGLSVCGQENKVKKTRNLDSLAKHMFDGAESIENIFGNVKTKAATGATTDNNNFEYVPNATWYDDHEQLERINAENQPFKDKVIRAIKQTSFNSNLLIVGVVTISLLSSTLRFKTKVQNT